MQQIRFTSISGSPWQLLRMMSWRGVLAVAAALTMLLTITLLAGAALLVLTPIVFVGAMIGRWFMGKRATVTRTDAPTDLIEGRFEVIEVQTPPRGGSDRAR